MKTYIVTVLEIWEQGYRVEADSPEEAVFKVDDDKGEVVDDLFEWSHRLLPADWKVEEVES